MDVLEAIHSRRSVRKFQEGKAVDEDLVRELLGAAMTAPSAGNAQPWQFVVIDDRATLDKVPAIHPYAAMAAKAPLGILVCGDLSLEKYPGFWVQDCAAAVQNLLLAAHARNLGAVWTGIYPDVARTKDFRELVHLPPHVIPLALIVIGHPDQPVKHQDRYDAAKVHRNTW